MKTKLLRSIAALVGLCVLMALLVVGCQSFRHSGGPDLAAKPKGALRLATYNVHYILMNESEGRWSVGHWERRKGPLDAAFKAMGGELNQFYLVMGRYDMVVIGEAPDDETAAKLALAIGSQGAIRTETLRAFTEEEYRTIISALP